MNQSLLKKAIDLLCIAYSEMRAEDIARRSIGERDAGFCVYANGYLVLNSTVVRNVLNVLNKMNGKRI